MTNRNDANPTVFHDMDEYLKVGRLGGLSLSPDGTRLLTTVSTLDPAGTGFRSAVWEVDPAGKQAARQLTTSSKGESSAEFTGNGSILFTSSRPDPRLKDDQESAALFLLPARGEASCLLSRPGGVEGVVTNPHTSTFLVAAPLFASAQSAADSEAADAALRKERKEKKVSAILHQDYPVRFWDHDVSADSTQLFTLQDGALRCISAGVGKGFFGAEVLLSPDGRYAYANVSRQSARAQLRSAVVRVDVGTGERSELHSEAEADFAPVDISDDGKTLVLISERESTPQTAPDHFLWLLDIESAQLTPVAAKWDRWPGSASFIPGSTDLLVTANEGGREPIFRVSTETGEVTRLTGDGAFTDVHVSPDGKSAYALRFSYEFPSEPVRIDLKSGKVTELLSPVSRPVLPGTLQEVSTQAADGAEIRAWLAVPNGPVSENTGPHPLLLWVHGGPLMSWNGWSWRWNPWLLVSKGYAVLLPDPRLSDGYGQDFVQDGWAVWGEEPFTDLMAITDEALKRPDLDETRTAAMGGSFGGYMANWIAGHTTRFRAIVSHASLWNLPAFGSTTDMSSFWSKEISLEMAQRNSPHQAVADIATPMLVIHGDKDYRVPISEGLALWYDLVSKSQLAMDDDGNTPHRFLYFPSENHWVLSPEHSRVWYQVVEAYLAEHVLGQKTPTPAILGN